MNSLEFGFKVRFTKYLTKLVLLEIKISTKPLSPVAEKDFSNQQTLQFVIARVFSSGSIVELNSS